VDNFTAYSEDDLNDLLEGYVELVYSDDDYTLEDASLATYNDIPYFYVSYSVTLDSGTYHVLDCETVMNQLDYIYTIFSYEDALTDSQVSALENLVSSAQYTTPTGTGAVEAPSDEPSIAAEAEAEESALPEAVPDSEESQEEEITDVVSSLTDSSTLLLNLLGGLVAGLVMGLIPLIVGLKKRQKALAWSGFGACILSGLLLGLLLSLPVAMIFLIIILVRGKKTPKGGSKSGYSSYTQSSSGTQDPWDQNPGTSGDPW
jgi:hypothetical protein